jgi:DNA-binding NarL/FixJ family response regulator
MSETPKPRPTVVLADDHPRTLAATCHLMRQAYDVLAAVGDGQDAVDAIARLNPDVAVLDVAMPGTDGFEAARRIRELAIPTRIVFLTITEDWDYALTASKLGASYVLKRRIYTDLIPAVNETLAGRLFLSPLAAASPRNYDVLRP